MLWRELFSRQYPRSQLAASSMADWRRCFELEVNHLQVIRGSMQNRLGEVIILGDQEVHGYMVQAVTWMYDSCSGLAWTCVAPSNMADRRWSQPPSCLTSHHLASRFRRRWCATSPPHEYAPC